MIFYRTTAGDLAPTQALAGKGFVQVDVPVTKAELMAYINNLMARPPVELEHRPDCPATDGFGCRSDEPITTTTPTPTQVPHYGEPVCEACARTKVGAAVMAQHIDLHAVTNIISNITNPVLLNEIKDYLNEITSVVS